jgi:glyoxylase-like metal-dependent hydrolase (beta-lactamase superfamily II)
LLDLGNGAGEIVLHQEDWFLWERAELQAQELDFPELLPEKPFPKPSRSFQQGEELPDCGNLSVICLHTPGVSPGSACYYFPQIELVCTGTTLLSQSVGRTTWMGIKSLEGTSSARTLRRSIDDVLLASVPGDTRVVPAFGPLTTLRHEAQKNAHLQKLSSRWGAYNDTQEMKAITEGREKKVEIEKRNSDHDSDKNQPNQYCFTILFNDLKI